MNVLRLVLLSLALSFLTIPNTAAQSTATAVGNTCVRTGCLPVVLAEAVLKTLTNPAELTEAHRASLDEFRLVYGERLVTLAFDIVGAMDIAFDDLLETFFQTMDSLGNIADFIIARVPGDDPGVLALMEQAVRSATDGDLRGALVLAANAQQALGSLFANNAETFRSVALYRGFLETALVQYSDAAASFGSAAEATQLIGGEPGYEAVLLEKQAEAYLNSGVILGNIDDLGEAIVRFEALLVRLDLPIDTPSVKHNLGLAYVHRGIEDIRANASTRPGDDFERAITLYLEAAEDPAAAARQPLRAAIYANLGVAYRNLADVDLVRRDALLGMADAAYQTALSMFEDLKGLGVTEANRGNALREAADFAAALAAYDRAIGLLSDYGASNELARAYYGEGRVFIDRVRCFEQEIPCPGPGPVDMDLTTRILAQCEAAVPDGVAIVIVDAAAAECAFIQARASLQTRSTTGEPADTGLLPVILDGLGTARFFLGNVEQALDDYNTLLAMTLEELEKARFEANLARRLYEATVPLMEAGRFDEGVPRMELVVEHLDNVLDVFERRDRQSACGIRNVFDSLKAFLRQPPRADPFSCP